MDGHVFQLHPSGMEQFLLTAALSLSPSSIRTEANVAACRRMARGRSLAASLLHGADNKRYASLIFDTENGYRQENKQFPSTLDAALDLTSSYHRIRFFPPSVTSVLKRGAVVYTGCTIMGLLSFIPILPTTVDALFGFVCAPIISLAPCLCGSSLFHFISGFHQCMSLRVH